MLKNRIKTSQSKKAKRFPSKERIQPDKNKTRVNVSSKSDIIVLFGQSNSSNSVLSNEYSKSKHLNYFNKKFYRLSNPVLGADGDRGGRRGWRRGSRPRPRPELVHLCVGALPPL